MLAGVCLGIRFSFQRLMVSSVGVFNEQVGLTKNGRSLPGMVTAMLLPTGQDSDKVRCNMFLFQISTNLV